jgi:ATP-dependent Zn protease
MAGSVGLAGPMPLVYLGAVKDAREFLSDDTIREAVNTELEKAAASCRELLEHNRGAVEQVARRLSQASRIDGAEVALILSQRASEPPSGDNQ